MNRVAGRGILLTGASGGIGRALALALVAEGATVYAVGRDAVALSALASAAQAGRIHPVVADLGNDVGIAAVKAVVDTASPAISTVVLGAATSTFGLFESQSSLDIEQQISTNLLAPLRLVKAVLPRLLTREDPTIVAIGSTFGSLAYPGFAAYSASKFGLRGFTEALAREHADGPLRVQYLAPRATRTAFNPPAVDALNAELGVAVDAPEAVAAALARAMVQGRRRLQLGWPEKLFARLNGVLPALIDAALAKQLGAVRRHAHSQPTPQEI